MSPLIGLILLLVAEPAAAPGTEWLHELDADQRQLLSSESRAYLQRSKEALRIAGESSVEDGAAYLIEQLMATQELGLPPEAVAGVQMGYLGDLVEICLSTEELSELALVVIDTLRPKLAPRLEPYVRTLEARALANVGQRRNAVKTLEEIRKSPDVPDRCRIVASTSLADVHRRGGDPYGAVRVLQEMKSEFDLDRKLEQSADSAIVNDIQTVGDPALERQSLEAFLEKWRGDMPADQEVAFRERLGHRLMEMGSHEAALAQFRSAQKLWSEQPDPESLGAVESRKAAIRDAIRSAEARLAAAERVKALIAE